MILATTLPVESVRWLRARLAESAEALGDPHADIGAPARPGPRWNAASPTSHGFAFAQLAVRSGRRSFLIQLLRDFEGARAVDVMRRDPGSPTLRFVIPLPGRIPAPTVGELAALTSRMAQSLEGGPSPAAQVVQATTRLARHASIAAVEAAAVFPFAAGSCATLRCATPADGPSLDVRTADAARRRLPLLLTENAAAAIGAEIGSAASLTAANGTYEIAALRATGDPSLIGAVERLRILARQEEGTSCVAAR